MNSFPTAWKSQTPATAYTMPAGTATFAAAFTPGVATGDLAITIDPGSDTMASLFVGHEPAPGARKIFGAFSFSATSITPKMPMAGTCSVTARGTTASGASAVTWRVALKAPSSVTVKLPVGDLKTTTPATNATGVGSGTSFAWTPVAGYMYYTRINCGSPTPTYLADFVTDSPSFTLPDTSALGVSVPASAACSWVVNAFAPVANVDGLVGPAGWINAQDTNFGTVDGTELRTGSSLFTSK